MARKRKKSEKISATGRYRWIDASTRIRNVLHLARVDRARKLDLSTTFSQNGQILAGSGALVFEGELLEQPRDRSN